MWLLNTPSLILAQFTDDNTPHYAILSHTWGAEEVSFQDMQSPHERISIRAGYKKVKECCAQALTAGFQYAWIDTCCIDKTNNTELSEAINSMFRWYQNAAACYAYLEDVKPSEPQAFASSRWFTRGWTLQELIAPIDVLFFDHSWNEIGSRASLGEAITRIPGIPFSVMMNAPLQDHSLAEIMSWAAGRKTTRIEDRAYSLLGLFGVSMPMIYGEGEKAFMRLQLEIMKTTTDHSLFAWHGIGDNKSPLTNGNDRGALARSPDEFRNCGMIRSYPITDDSPYDMTNLGLRITLPCQLISDKTGSFVGCDLFAHLNCKDQKPNGLLDERPIGIWLRAVKKYDKPTGQYVRTRPWLLSGEPATWKKKPKPTLLYIIQPDIHRFRASVSTYNDPLLSPCSLDYSALLKEGYNLEAESEWGDLRSQENQSSIAGEVEDSLASRPWVVFFMHKDRMERFWVALSIFEGRFFSMIEPRVGISETPETILKHEPPELANRRNSSLVLDRITKGLPSGHVVKLTVKRGIISDRAGYLVKISIYHEKQDAYPPSVLSYTAGSQRFRRTEN